MNENQPDDYTQSWPALPDAGHNGYDWNTYGRHAQTQPRQHPRHLTVAPKSAGVCVIASFLIPGLGSMLAGRGGKGAAILIAHVFAVILTLLTAGLAFPIPLGLWVYSMVAANNDAVKWNRTRGIVS